MSKMKKNNSTIQYFKHIIHIDDFPLIGHPPSIYTILSVTSQIFVYSVQTYMDDKINQKYSLSCHIDVSG